MRPSHLLLGIASMVILLSSPGMTASGQTQSAKPPTASQSSSPASPAPASRLGAANFSELIAGFKTAMDTGNYDPIIDLGMPPKVLARIIAMSGVDGDPDQLRRQLKTQARETLQQGKIISYTLDGAGAQQATSPSARKYALVPSTLVIEIQGQRMKATTTYVALIDDGRWFLIDPSEPKTSQIVKAVYPDLADVTFAESRMEVVAP